MSTNQLTESKGVAPVSKNVHITRGQAWRSIAATAGLLGAYGAATVFLLAHSMAKVYGFPVLQDIRTRIEIALQLCPMLAAIGMVLLSRAKDRQIEYLVSCSTADRPLSDERNARTICLVAVNFLWALAFVFATACAFAVSWGTTPGIPEPGTLWWVAGELTLDITLIGIFTTALFTLTRRAWLTVLLFTAYATIVILAGGRWGLTSYIGFASGVPVMLTTYSTAPLYDTAAWLFRGYWASVTIFFLVVLHAFLDASEPLPVSIAGAFRTRQRGLFQRCTLSIAALALSVAAGLWLHHLQRYGVARYQAASNSQFPAAWRSGGEGTGRLHLKHYDVRFNYHAVESTADVQGTLTFLNPANPLRTAYFEVPGLVEVQRLEVTGAGTYQIETSGRLVRVTLDQPLEPGHTAGIEYAGTIRAAGPFDLSTQAKVLRSGFFLANSDLLYAARSAACLDAASGSEDRAPSRQTCGQTEDYLMSDSPTGEIAVLAPKALSVAAPGEETIRARDPQTSEHLFRIAAPRIGSFMIACAPFLEKQSTSADGKTRVRVFGSAATSAMGGFQAGLAQRILAYYRTVWPGYQHRDLQIIETPTPLGEAVAFDGAIAISDNFLTSRDPVSGLASNLLEFVMAHEIAHQWWGYRIVPARSPGRLFLLESFPQFAAYEYLDNRGVLSSKLAEQNEKRRYQLARARSGGQDIALAQLEMANAVAYNKGPLVLLSLDELAGHSLMHRLGVLIDNYSHDSSTIVQPDRVFASLIDQLPEEHRAAARELVYQPDRKRDGPLTALR